MVQRSPQADLLRHFHSGLNFDLKQGRDLLPSLARGPGLLGTALARRGQQTHPGRRFGQRGDALLPQVLQLDLVLVSVLLFRADYLEGRETAAR